MAYIICALITLAFVIIYKSTKWYFISNFKLYHAVEYIPHLFNIHPCYNTGAAWSMLEENPIILQIFSVIGTALIIYLLKDFSLKRRPLYSYGLTLALAGTVGNMIDRIFYPNGVIDFIQFAFYPSFPTFNIADSCLCIGVAMIAVFVLFFEQKDPIQFLPDWMKRQKKDEDDEWD